MWQKLLDNEEVNVYIESTKEWSSAYRVVRLKVVTRECLLFMREEASSGNPLTSE